jgi:hypothetical protein
MRKMLSEQNGRPGSDWHILQIFGNRWELYAEEDR